MTQSRKQPAGRSHNPLGIAPPTGSIHSYAARIAEAVDETWHNDHGHGDWQVPVSVVATLALIAPPPDKRDRAAAQVAALDNDVFTHLMRAQWGQFVNARPDLITPAWPLVSVWDGENAITGPTVRAAQRVAKAALQRGLWHLSAEPELRCSLDLLGHVLTTLRGRKAATAHSAFYTAPGVADAMAHMLGAPEEGTQMHEPTAGTGGMLRALAQAMRHHGRDPATVTWAAVDVDPLAIACLAANALLWGLGPRVLLGVGDILTDDWIAAAEAQRRHTLDLAGHIRRDKAMLQALDRLTRGDAA
ncbi:hypothetical protein GCM10023224_15670 [Streptomonospora halophila]|uniref:DNA methylase adenine-specific domain-containing protein n=1 Tax=Streptomonospora halophila TaxID=427369 RepID=A0ABP9GAS5_9ACTN